MAKEAAHSFTAPHAELPEARAGGRYGRVTVESRPRPG